MPVTLVVDGKALPEVVVCNAKSVEQQLHTGLPAQLAQLRQARIINPCIGARKAVPMTGLTVSHQLLDRTHFGKFSADQLTDRANVALMMDLSNVGWADLRGNGG